MPLNKEAKPNQTKKIIKNVRFKKLLSDSHKKSDINSIEHFVFMKSGKFLSNL